MKNLQVMIDDDQYKALRLLAVDSDTSVSELIRAAVVSILRQDAATLTPTKRMRQGK